MVDEVAWVRRACGGPAPDRGEARRRLGLDGSTLVITPLADDAGRIDACRAMFLAGVIEMLGQRVTLVLPRNAGRLPAARRYAEGAMLMASIKVVEPPLVAAWPAVDVVFEIDQSMAHLDGTAEESALTAWAGMCGVALRRSVRRAVTAESPVAPVAHTLWWAAELPARLRSNP